MDLGLKGKLVLVTGGSKGIGLVFLASPRASYVTGTTLTMDGALNPGVL